MEKILDRFLRYVGVDTQSNEESETQPSTAKQWDLLKMLCAELQEMGIEAELDEYGYVMGTIPSNIPGKDTISLFEYSSYLAAISGICSYPYHLFHSGA